MKAVLAALVLGLLGMAAARAATFRRGTRVYDPAALGYVDDGPYVLDARTARNANAGADYGTDLSAADKRDLIEHLKTY